MGLEDLVNGYKEVVETIYSDKYYYERIHTLFRNFNPPRRTTARPSFSDLRTLFKSMWKIGIVSKGRAHYWKLLFWAIRRPQYLHTAVTFIIHGFHFRKVFSEASAV